MPHAPPAPRTPEPRTLNPGCHRLTLSPAPPDQRDCAAFWRICQPDTPAGVKILICAPQKHEIVDTLGAAAAENPVRSLTVAVRIACAKTADLVCGPLRTRRLRPRYAARSREIAEGCHLGGIEKKKSWQCSAGEGRNAVSAAKRGGLSPPYVPSCGRAMQLPRAPRTPTT